MNKPTHEEISQRAHQLWEIGQPAGADANQNWLDAERELTAEAPKSAASASPPTHLVAAPLSESASKHAVSERDVRQKKQAREPIVATHTGPKAATPESGKPIWSQPHSS